MLYLQARMIQELEKKFELTADFTYWSEVNANPKSPSYLFIQMLIDNDWSIQIGEGPYQREPILASDARPKRLAVFVAPGLYSDLSRLSNYAKSKPEYRNLEESYYNENNNALDEEKTRSTLQQIYEQTIEEHPELQPQLAKSFALSA